MKKLNKVLLVDDDEIVNSINKVIIQHVKFADQVMTESVPANAINWIKSASHTDLPELILLDINMPEMDGWGFVDEFEKAGFKGDFPKIIMLTSSINPRDEQRANNAKEISGFISKPLSPELLETIGNDFF